jgi:hypothetical protein
MPFIVIVIGAILIVAAFNETHGDLAHALEQDIPGFFKWAMAIAAILGLGFVPGLRVPSRWLIALVALVIIVTNYQAIFGGFTKFAQADPTTGGGNPDPTAAYVQSGGQGGAPTQTQIAGESGGGGGGGSQMAGGGALDPGTFLNMAQGFGGGLGGLAAGFGGLL